MSLLDSTSSLARLALPAMLALWGVALSGTRGTAQNSYLFSPARLAATEGEFFSYMFGAWPKLQYQMIDGENRGTASQLKAIAFRLDHRSHTSLTTAIGRTWSNVTLHLAEGDLNTLTNVFTQNTVTTPTRVFSGPVTWPNYNGTPLTRPALWGGAGNSYRLPFQTNWGYTGNLDIVSDWSFDGGRLTNGNTWSTALKGYWLDSYHDPDEPHTGTYRSVPAIRLDNNSPGVTSRCNDSFFGGQTTGSYANLFARAYGPDASQPSWRNKLVIWSSSTYTAPGASVIHAWAFGTHDVGFQLGTGCNNLHLLGLTLFLTHSVPPSSTNPTGYVRTQPIATDWIPGLSSLRVVMQAGWADSVSGQLRLSQAQEVILPFEQPPPIPRRAALYQDPGSPVQGPDRSYLTNPAMRYDR